MNDLAEFVGTSMCTPGPVLKPETTIRYGGILDEQGTSSGLVWGGQLLGEAVAPHRVAEAAAPARANMGAAAALDELRRLTGFTGDQVARALEVTARTLFLWKEGRPINRANEERLQRLVALLRRVDRGSPDANRAALFGARSDGTVPFDLLVAGDLERAEATLSVQRSMVPVPERTLRERRPMAPAEMMGLSDEKVHAESGVVRTARSRRLKKGD